MHACNIILVNYVIVTIAGLEEILSVLIKILLWIALDLILMATISTTVLYTG